MYLECPSWDDLVTMPIHIQHKNCQNNSLYIQGYPKIMLSIDTLKSLRKAWPTRILPFINSATFF